MSAIDKKLVIAFDARSAARSSKSGIGYYAHGAIQALNDYYGDRVVLVGHYYNFLGRQSPHHLPTGASIRYAQSRLAPEKGINALRRIGIELPFELLTKCRADVHFFPDYLSQPTLLSTPAVTTIHDLAYHDMPDTVSSRNRRDLERFVPLSIRRSSVVATVSNSAKQRIGEVYNPCKPFVVTYTPPALPPPPPNFVDELAAIHIKGKYMLFLGTLEPRKNITKLIAAYSQLDASVRNTYSLVLAGGSGWNNSDILRAIEQANLQGLNVITPGYVTERQRSSLYHGAAAFIFPSSYEGYGIPPLEAMSARVPVLVSDIPVHREVCAGAAWYCDPTNAADIAAKLQAILKDTSIRQELVKQGTARAAEFSWQKVADTLYEAFVQCAGN